MLFLGWIFWKRVKRQNIILDRIFLNLLLYIIFKYNSLTLPAQKRQNMNLIFDNILLFVVQNNFSKIAFLRVQIILSDIFDLLVYNVLKII